MRRSHRRRGYAPGYIAPHKRIFKAKRLGGQTRGGLFGRPRAAASVHESSAALPQGALGGAVSIALSVGVLLGLLFLGWAMRFSDAAIMVTVEQNGFSRTILTKAETVEQLFQENEIATRADDRISHMPESVLQEGMRITIESTFPVAVTSRGDVTILRMHEGSVGDALARAGIQYDAADEITRLPFEDIAPGMHIQHIEVETTYETADQVIEYKEEEIKDSSRYIGDDRINVEGENGEKRIVRRLIYKDGELASREIMNQIILKEAVDEVKIVGTKFRAQTKYTGDERAWKEKPGDSEIKQTMVAVEITAYTHTGRRTATGKWPKIGYVAVNPNVIPYGTKLYIPGYGYCTAQDTGAFRHEDGGMKNQLDIFLNTEKECRSWGSKKNVTFYILK